MVSFLHGGSVRISIWRLHVRRTSKLSCVLSVDGQFDIASILVWSCGLKEDI